MQINTLLAILPLPERMIALADLAGERLRPAFYSPLGDAGAVAQNVLLRPAVNEGPYVIVGAKLPVTGTATGVRVSINANGTDYVPPREDGTPITYFPSHWNAPIVVAEGGQAIFRLIAGGGAHGTVRGYFTGFHCSPRFAEMLRETGELWADHLKIAYTEGQKQLAPMERNTLLELLAFPTVPTDNQLARFSLRVHDVLVTPTDLAAVSTMFTTASGFGRAPLLTTDLSGRCPIRIPRGGVIQASMNASAGTLETTFIGRRVWIG